MSDRRKYFIPSRITGGWQLYGLSVRHLLRLAALPIILGAGLLITVVLWGVAPATGTFRLVLRALYALIPLVAGGVWVGIAVIPIDSAGRTWFDIRRLASEHRNRQTVFLPRNMKMPR